MSPSEFKDRKFASGKPQRCWMCRCFLNREGATVDHLVPRSVGGTNGIANMRLACHKCNQLRGARLLTQEEWARIGGRQIPGRRRRDLTNLIDAIKRHRQQQCQTTPSC